MYALENLISFYNMQQKGDVYYSVIERLLSNLDMIEKSTIYDCAEICYVSTSTISRLCKKLGYSSFPEFKFELVNSIHNFNILNRYAPINFISEYGSEQEAYLNILSKIINDFSNNLDKKRIEELTEIIFSYNDIRIYTHGIDFAEKHFQQNLIMTSKKARLICSPIMQLEDVKDIKEKTLVITTLPNVHEKTLGSFLLKQIKENKGDVMLLTNSNYSQYIKYADYHYCFNGTMTQLDDYHFAMFLSILSITYRKRYFKDQL